MIKIIFTEGLKYNFATKGYNFETKGWIYYLCNKIDLSINNKLFYIRIILY